MRKAKQLLSGFLAVVMILSLIPDISVRAQEIGISNESVNEEINNKEIISDEFNSDYSDIDDINIDNDNKNETDMDNSGEDDFDEDNSDEDYFDEDDSDDDSDKENFNNDDSNRDDANNDNSGNDASDQDDSEQTPPLQDDPVSGETDEEENLETSDDKASDLDDIDNEEENNSDVLVTSGWEKYQFFIFPQNKDDIVFTVPDNVNVMPIDHVASTTLYAVNIAMVDDVVFEASVHYGQRLQIPEDLKYCITENQKRELLNDRWIYHYRLNISHLSTTYDEPFAIRLKRSRDDVSIEVNGDAKVEGVDEDGMAQLGSVVSIEVLNPGDTLAMISEDEKGNTIYTAMELDYNNCYEFTVEEELSFVVANPAEVGYAIAYADSRKAKLTGEAGLKLKTLTSSAQGYSEIVLNFTAIPNGSDGTETENAYYEVRVAAAPKNGESVPAGSSEAPAYKYYYIRKTENINTQSRSIIVNNGDLSAPTACTYEFSVRLVHISKTTFVPSENSFLNTPLEAVLSGNTITKTFTTKNLYYEDKISFTKKNTKIYTGQTNVLTGTVKYSKKASYLHDLTAVAYNQGGAVEDDITCTFKNDNDELYISADEYTEPGKYTVVIYAGIGEVETKNNPQCGTMYQANTSFTLTVEPGINFIDTGAIVKQVAVANKNSTFSVVPVGWSGYYGYKAKKQKFTYEIKSAIKVDNASASGESTTFNYQTVEPTEKVKNNISVNKNGKVTIKKGYTVDADNGEDYIAVIIKAADFENNSTAETVYIKVLNTVLIPTQIRLYKENGTELGTSFTADKADYWHYFSLNLYVSAKVVVLDQFGNNMNRYVTITPNGNYSSNKNGVDHNANSDDATLYIHKMGTITIKAVSTDGGKKSKSVKFRVTAPEVKGNGLYSLHSITNNGNDIYDYKIQSGSVTYSAPKGSIIKIYNGFDIDYNNHTNHNGNNCVGAYNRSWINWKYEIKGDKLKFDGNLWVITPTEKTTTLITWPKSNPNHRSKVSFTNTSWKDYDAAPRVTLVSGKAYSNKYGNNSDLIEDGYYDDETGEWVSYNYISAQQLTYRYNSGNYDSIMIRRLSKKAPEFWISDFDKGNRTFKLNINAGNIKAGSYKYSIAFYNDKNKGLDGKPVSSMSTKTATITIKVYKAPKIKISPSYILKTDQADSVTLKCTPGDFLPDFEPKLLNANIGGKTNDFSDYFEVTTSTDSMGVSRASVKLKKSLTSEQKASLKGKKITGYIKYSYYYGYDHIENATSKITISVK